MTRPHQYAISPPPRPFKVHGKQCRVARCPNGHARAPWCVWGFGGVVSRVMAHTLGWASATWGGTLVPVGKWSKLLCSHAFMCVHTLIHAGVMFNCACMQVLLWLMHGAIWKSSCMCMCVCVCVCVPAVWVSDWVSILMCDYVCIYWYATVFVCMAIRLFVHT